MVTRASRVAWTLAVAALALASVLSPGHAGMPGSATPRTATSPALSGEPNVLVKGSTVTVAPGLAPSAGTTRLAGLPSSTPMTVLVGLASQDPQGENAQATSEYIAGSGTFHQYLTPTEVASRFGATSVDIDRAVAYFAGAGISATPDPNGRWLTLHGSAAAVGQAFDTSFSTYRDASGRTFFSHSTPATLPSSIPWSGVLGLGNVTPLEPLAVPLPQTSPLVGPATTCTTGSSGLSPCQIWGAYDAAGLLANGTNGSGVRIGIVDAYDSTEPQHQLASDLASFDGAFALPAPSVSYNYPVRATNNINTSAASGWALEESLDLEWSHASAPGGSIAMTFSPNSGVGLYQAVDWLVANHLVDVISLSWGEPDVGIYNAYAGGCTYACNATSDGSYEILGPVFAAAALEGISVFVASGDCGSADGTSGVATDYPSSDPFVTGVGGTSLDVTATGGYVGETAWSGNSTGAVSPGCQNQGGSGGGYAPFPRPWWQHGTGLPTNPSTRGDPDVADDASTGVEIFEGGGSGGVGGTSLSTPLWAGIAALADQHAGTPLGFLNPTLYALLRGTHYGTDFHDIISGSNGYSATTGWDPVTGIGSPIVGALVTDLTATPISPTSLSLSLYAGPRLGSAPLLVSFQLVPQGGSDDYPLEGVYFGDGNSAFAVSGAVTHRYPVAGVFEAVAYVADSSGNVSSSVPAQVIVGGGGLLSVTLTASNATPSVGATVQFTAVVHGGTLPYTYQFNYGDGTFLNGTGSTIQDHAYSTAGSYCAEVFVADSATPINGGASPALDVTVGGATSTICTNDSTPLKVLDLRHPAVLDAPADLPALFQVVGGSNGSGNYSVSERLSSNEPYLAACGCFIFRNAGDYSVTLNASEPVGQHATNTTNLTIASPLVGSFSASPTYGTAPLDVNFSVVVTGGTGADASLASWSFGNGVGATGATASATYTTPGLYFATGVVADNGRGNASRGFLIDVLPAGDTTSPTITATVGPVENVAAGTPVHFTASSQYLNGTLVPAAFYWSLWQGASAYGPTAVATAEAPDGAADRAIDLGLNVSWPELGTSVSALLASPDFLAVETAGFVPRSDALTLAASGGPSNGTPPLTWNGRANVSGPGAGIPSWDFGDATTAGGATVSHQYVFAGAFTAVVSGSDAWGDLADLPFGVWVESPTPPNLTLTASVSLENGTAPLTVTFTATASAGAGPPYTYLWTFGDGSLSALANTTHTYTTAGNFTAVARATDASGLTVYERWSIEVAAPPPPPANSTSGLPLEWIVVGALAAGAAGGVLAVLVERRRHSGRPPTP